MPAFAASSDFAITKPAGTACPHLQQDFRCGIHSTLRQRGFPGCTVYDCFGAGQQVSQVTFGGTDGRSASAVAEQMSVVFPLMRQLHELLFYLREALGITPYGGLHAELEAALAATVRMTGAPADEIAGLDVGRHRDSVNDLLLKASEDLRRGIGRPTKEHRGADLVGATLRRADLRGANLRGALLLGADLTEADLRQADLIGADLRGARVAGADLTGSLFLTQSQVNAALGDARTRLPAGLARPGHWPT